MFFDDIVNKNRNLASQLLNGKNVFLRDAVVFKFEHYFIQEASTYFKEKGKRNFTDTEIDYCRTPYTNMFIQLGNSYGFWINGNKLEKEKQYYIHLVLLGSVFDDLVKYYKKIGWSDDDCILMRSSGITIDLDERAIGFNFIRGLDCSKFTQKEMEKQPGVRICVNLVYVVVRAITLLNCVNIKTIKHHPPAKLQKARRRRGKLPLTSYYTLQLDLGKEGNPSRGNKEPEHHKRIHLCRGHFKKYTKEKPLFGKLTGLWWWQPYVRGQNRDGVIHKDYAVIN